MMIELKSVIMMKNILLFITVEVSKYKIKKPKEKHKIKLMRRIIFIKVIIFLCLDAKKEKKKIKIKEKSGNNPSIVDKKRLSNSKSAIASLIKGVMNEIIELSKRDIKQYIYLALVVSL